MATLRVNSGAFDVLHTDDELAALIGHEVSHNLMKHGEKDLWNQVFTTIGFFATFGGMLDTTDLSTRANDAFGRSFELEADYLGAYLTALAGYDPAGALSEIQLGALYNPDNISRTDQFKDIVEDYLMLVRHSHPEDGERYTQVKKTVEKIKEMQRQGLKPLPDFLY